MLAQEDALDHIVLCKKKDNLPFFPTHNFYSLFHTCWMTEKDVVNDLEYTQRIN